MNPPDFTLDKIKFATDESTLKKAFDLYASGKVMNVEEGIRSYSGIVMGTHPYRVSVEARRYDYADCTCYLGENEKLCKHMVALAIYAVKNGQPLTDTEKEVVHSATCSGRLGIMTDKELAAVKTMITGALRYIKPYTGPSRIWFAYQDTLCEGANRLSAIVSELPISLQTAGLLVDLLLRLDKKLCTGGVDDSDGTVGEFMTATVEILQEFAQRDPTCVKAFKKLRGRETCFSWEEPLLKYIV